MDGTRDAPQIWAEVVRSTLDRLGYKQSVSQPTVYCNLEKDVIVFVHVDDFLCTLDGRGPRGVACEAEQGVRDQAKETQYGEEYSKEVHTPSLNELEEQTGQELAGDVATKVRRRSVRIN